MEEYKVNVILNKDNYILVANSANMFRIFKNSKLIESGCCDSFEDAKKLINNYAKTKLKGGKKVKAN